MHFQTYSEQTEIRIFIGAGIGTVDKFIRKFRNQKEWNISTKNNLFIRWNNLINLSLNSILNVVDYGIQETLNLASTARLCQQHRKQIGASLIWNLKFRIDNLILAFNVFYDRLTCSMNHSIDRYDNARVVFAGITDVIECERNVSNLWCDCF